MRQRRRRRGGEGLRNQFHERLGPTDVAVRDLRFKVSILGFGVRRRRTLLPGSASRGSATRSMSGRGRRMLLYAILPRPSSLTYIAGSAPSFSEGARSLSASGANTRWFAPLVCLLTYACRRIALFASHTPWHLHYNEGFFSPEKMPQIPNKNSVC